MKQCHFIGIGGMGMSALAHLALSKNVQVTGSDLSFSPITHSLESKGAKIFIGHSAQHIQDEMTVVYSTDIKKNNPEYTAALSLNCTMLHRSQLLQILMQNHKSLAVAGTHGKTTTSSLLTWILESSGLSPSYAVGGVISQLSSNSGEGSGPYFVAEACESDGSFLNYFPFGAIVTNIDLDHMDYYQSEQSLTDAFNTFTTQVTSPQHLFWCGDDKRLKQLNPHGVSYGFGDNCQLKAANFRQKGWKSMFNINFKGMHYLDVEIALTGEHNALNALAVFGMALSLGIEEKNIRSAFSSFQGVLRRCEHKGECQGITLIDDYAHHPTEIKAVLRAIREAIGERRLVVVYQPHRYSRVQECKGLYGNVFNEADLLFITEIYSARESEISGVSEKTVIEEVQKTLKNRCEFVLKNDLCSKLSDCLRPHDVLLSLGAGDITHLADEVIEYFKIQPLKKLKLGLIFGGMSVEHDISLISSANILKALNSDYYKVEEFGISRQGCWICSPEVRNVLNTARDSSYPKISYEVMQKLLDCDILFPVLHGTYGEDGAIQGVFDMLLKAYVGCDHRASAICMDKVVSKLLAKEAGVPTLPFIAFNRHEWEKNRDSLLLRIAQELSYPLFVKPSHLGSSIGVHKVTDQSFLLEAIEDAFRYDYCLMVEKGLEKVREIEFSLYGNYEVTVFPPGEVYSCGNLHDYESKYGLNPDRPAAKCEAKAKLSEEKIEEGMLLAKKVYQAIQCSGLSRIDMFLDVNQQFWFNEINPLPGFTQHSLYPIMCAANGLSLDLLCDKLIILAMQRRRYLDRLEV